jgi:hypothetical protein
MRKITRVGLLAVSLWGMLGTVGPTPAEATTAGKVTFTGIMTVGHGIADPLIDNSQPGPPFHVTTHKTPPQISNSATITGFIATLCTAEIAAVGKSGQTKTTAGNCAMGPGTPLGTMHGYCGFSDGVISLSVAAGGFSYSVHLSFAETAKKMTLAGHFHKHGTVHSGTVRGDGTIQVNAADGSSCTNKAAKNFVVTGNLTFTGTSAPVSFAPASHPRVSTPLSVSTSMG